MRGFITILLLSACFGPLLAGCAAPVTKYPDPNPLSIESEAMLQKRLARGGQTSLQQQKSGRDAGPARDRLQRVALKVLTAAASLCGVNVKNQISIDITASALDYPEIVSVIDPEFSTPEPAPFAEAYDIRAGDRLVSISGQSLDRGHSGFRSALETLVELEQAGEGAMVQIRRQQQVLSREIRTVSRCHYYIEAAPHAEQPNAFSDGESVLVTTSLVRIMPTDDELAFILGHEIGHNLLGHANKTKIQVQLGYLAGTAKDIVTGWWPRDEFAQLGSYLASRIYTKAQEMEADYLGVYLMTMAGYDPDASLLAMRRLGFYSPLDIDYDEGSSHPSTALRAAAIKQTIAEVKEKQARKEMLVPAPNRDFTAYEYDFPK